VRHIFGLCGDTSLPFYDALYRRVTGRPGVCEGPSGGGATYLVPGLVEANESSIPVLGITSDVAVLSRGRYPLTELDQRSLYRPLTKWNTVCDRAEQVPQAFRSAFRMMTTGRPGSAHISLPYDVLKERVDATDAWAQSGHDRYPAWPSTAAPGDIASAAQAIVLSRRPVFICGGGVISARAMSALEKVATLLGAPVCTTVSGKGSISEAHALSAGVVGSNGGVIATREVVQQADLVIFVGCRAGSTTTEHWKYPGRDIPIVHIDVDPAAISANYRTAHALVGDARLVLEGLLEALSSVARSRSDVDGAAIVARARKTKHDAFLRLATEDASPIRPERVLYELHKVLPRDAIVVADPGTPCPYVSAYYDVLEAGRHFITNRAHGALAYALPAAAGAWFGRPASKCAALMGDGSFGFVVGELETLVRYRIPLLMIVFSNASYGWIKASQKASYAKRYFAVDFSRTDHARVAEQYGVRSWKVEDPQSLAGVLRQAAEHDGPALVDVIAQPLEDAAAPVLQWMG
jgi:acetolactate synthase-1/2/3 large subunit